MLRRLTLIAVVLGTMIVPGTARADCLPTGVEPVDNVLRIVFRDC